MVDKTKKSGIEKKELKKFGIILGIACLAWGLYFLLKKNQLFNLFFAISLILLMSALLAPIVLKPVQMVFKGLFKLIGWITTATVMLLVYYVIITPIGAISRIFGKDFLNKKWNPRETTYWRKRDERNSDESQYEKQF